MLRYLVSKGKGRAQSFEREEGTGYGRKDAFCHKGGAKNHLERSKSIKADSYQLP